MKIFLTSLFIFFTGFAIAQHMEPEGRIITFETPDGKMGRAYAVDAHPDTDEYVLVFTDGSGLSWHMKQMADKFAEDIGDIHVYVVDLYDGKVADDKETMLAQEKIMDRKRSEAIVKGIMDFVGTAAEVGLVGYGSGAEWAIEAGFVVPNNIRGYVLFNELPGIDSEELAQLEADVLALLVMPEDQMDINRINSFKEAMNKGNNNLTVERFDTSEASGNDFEDGPLEDAYERAFVFLQKRLN
ncbi:MAG: dienelactone hydrolase family protein [Candidatus Cyclobacteriaceae bacterium M2_1C_046]